MRAKCFFKGLLYFLSGERKREYVFICVFAFSSVGFLAYRLERASEPNGSRAKMMSARAS
jgi:hypothetical protein